MCDDTKRDAKFEQKLTRGLKNDMIEQNGW